MAAWSRDDEVVHTSTFAGAPLACATALATLDALSRDHLPERAAAVGERFAHRLAEVGVKVRGAGLMLGIELGGQPGAAVKLGKRLLAAGYLTSTGGGARETLGRVCAAYTYEAAAGDFVQIPMAAVQLQKTMWYKSISTH